VKERLGLRAGQPGIIEEFGKKELAEPAAVISR